MGNAPHGEVDIGRGGKSKERRHAQMVSLGVMRGQHRLRKQTDEIDATAQVECGGDSGNGQAIALNHSLGVEGRAMAGVEQKSVISEHEM